MPRVTGGGLAVDKPKNRMLKCPSCSVFREVWFTERFSRLAIPPRATSAE